MRIVVNCGTWIAYKSANGACYLYRKLVPKQHQPQMSHLPIINMTEHTSTTQQSQSAIIPNDNNDASYVLIMREEYDRLKGKSSII